MKIYSMNISGINPHDEKWYGYMSPKRMEKIDRLKKDVKKSQSIGVELLLCHAVKEITGENRSIEWDTDERGKLYLVNQPDIYVNLSHSGDWAVCAVSNAPVGVDIQYCREYDEGLIKRFFAADEAGYIEKSSDKKSAFYEIWTRKESFLKAVGKGITVPLNSFSVLADTFFYEGSNYKFKEYRVRDENYKLFVCFAPSPE